MKKFMIISAFTAVCLVIAGISSKQVKQDEFLSIMTNAESSNYSKPTSKTFSLKKIQDIGFSSPNAELTIVPTEKLTDTVVIDYIEYYSKKNREELIFPSVKESIENKKLKISFQSATSTPKTWTNSENINVVKSSNFPFFKFSVVIKNSEVKMQVPKDFKFNNLTLDIVSGEVEIPKMDINELQISLVTGKLRLVDLTAGNIDLEVTTGDIDLENVMFKSFNAEGVTGDIELRNVSLKADYKIETVAGDISISSKDSIDSNIKAESLTGDIEIDGVEHSKNVSIVSKTNPAKMYIEAVSGDIAITKTATN